MPQDTHAMEPDGRPTSVDGHPDARILLPGCEHGDLLLSLTAPQAASGPTSLGFVEVVGPAAGWDLMPDGPDRFSGLDWLPDPAATGVFLFAWAPAGGPALVFFERERDGAVRESTIA